MTRRENDKNNDKEYRLTEGQSKFIDSYIVTENAQESYYRAYPKCNWNTAGSNGSKLMAMDKIQKEIARRKADLKNSRHVASAEDVLMFLTQTMHSTDEKMSERLKAAEMIGKSLSLFNESNQATDTNFTINLVGFDEEQRKEIGNVIDADVKLIDYDE